MPDYCFRCVGDELFAAYHAIYSRADITCHDWNERLSGVSPGGKGILLLEDGKPIGGLTIDGRQVASGFLIAPFCDRELFWRLALAHALEESKAAELRLKNIDGEDAAALTVLGAKTNWTQQRMCRPTNRYAVQPPAGIAFSVPITEEIEEIVKVVYQAHANGYTSTVYGKPELADVEEAVNRRFVLFGQTNTLGFSVVARDRGSGAIVGVCLAGIYPDSGNRFSTIHQVSVLPAYRERGIARAMILSAIDAAHAISPVITLGVLIGNPAEHLYRKLGFVAGPGFAEMTYAKEETMPISCAGNLSF